MAEEWQREQEQRLKEVPEEYVAFWRGRLQRCRSGVLFVWGALTLPRGNLLPGAVLWISLHMLVAVIARMEGSAVFVFGNLVILTAILYSCVHVAIKYCKLNPFPLWSEESEKRYVHVCRCLGHLQTLLAKGYRHASASRQENPKMFYAVGFAVAFLLRLFGSLVSLTLASHLACRHHSGLSLNTHNSSLEGAMKLKFAAPSMGGVLLLPRALESGWLSESSLDVVGYVLHRAFESGRNTASAAWLRVQRTVAEVTVGNRLAQGNTNRR